MNQKPQFQKVLEAIASSKITDNLTDWILSFNGGTMWFNKFNSGSIKRAHDIVLSGSINPAVLAINV
ncbi:MAG: hypothetical protein ABSA75_13935 [Candidatus Bathyarchaeia archaeon]